MASGHLPFIGFAGPGSGELQSRTGGGADLDVPECLGSRPNFTGDRDLTKVRELNPLVQSFGDWLAKHKDDLKPSQN